MPDVVVTVPRSFGLEEWVDEGDAVGEPWSGEEWDFYLAGLRPNIKPAERVYVVYNGALRGYAPLIRLATPADSSFVRRRGASAFSLVRGGGAVAVTIPEYIQGFRGWRYRWWRREVEVPFPNWQDPWALASGVTRPAGAPTSPRERPDRPERPARPAGAEPAPIRCGTFPAHTHTWVPAWDPRFERCMSCPATRHRS